MRWLPAVLFLTCWPLAFYLTGVIEPTSGGWLKCAFAGVIVVGITAFLCIFARWTGRENLT